MMVRIGQVMLISLICCVSLASLIFAIKMAEETYFEPSQKAKPVTFAAPGNSGVA